MKYIRFAVAGMVLNIILSTIQKQFLISSEANETITQFMESSPSWVIVIFYITMILFVPFFEEAIFRGGIWKFFAYFSSDKVAAVIVAILFSLLHSWEAAFFLLPFSIFLSYLRYKNGNIWPGVVAHICFNLTGLLAPSLSV